MIGVRRVVEPAEAQRRSKVVPLGRVVEDDVENDLESGAVQRLAHVAKLVQRAERVLAAHDWSLLPSLRA